MTTQKQKRRGIIVLNEMGASDYHAYLGRVDEYPTMQDYLDDVKAGYGVVLEQDRVRQTYARYSVAAPGDDYDHLVVEHKPPGRGRFLVWWTDCWDEG